MYIVTKICPPKQMKVVFSAMLKMNVEKNKSACQTKRIISEKR